MLPDSVLSSITLSGTFLYPRNRRRSAFLDYELGGIGLNDPSAGLEYQVWRGRYIDANIVLDAPNTPPTVVYTRVGLHEFGFTFDQNMNPFIVFMDDFGSFFYWYDTTIADYRLSQLPFGSVNPRCCLDDKREMQTGASDIILAYTRNDSLYFRAQRDRYENEYLLTDSLPSSGILEQIGMNNKFRFQFGFMPGERVSPVLQPLSAYGTAELYGVVGKEYRSIVEAIGGATPYTWSVISGSLPTGLTLDGDSGIISGTPTTEGTSNFTVQVTDSLGSTDTLDQTIQVIEELALTGTLPNGQVSIAYSGGLTADGGLEPYVWTIQSGTLPDGLTLDSETGIISGTPTLAGTFDFTVRVTDALGSFLDSPQSITLSEVSSDVDVYWDNVVLLVDASSHSVDVDEHWDNVVLLVDGSL